VDHKKTLKKYIYERDNRKCYFCNKDLLFHQISLDHYLPKSEKGPDDLFNIVLSCKKCNKYKKNKIPVDYEEVWLSNFKQAIMDKRITSSVTKLKHKELEDFSKMLDKIESIQEDWTVLQGKKYRVYVKNNKVYKVINLG